MRTANLLSLEDYSLDFGLDSLLIHYATTNNSVHAYSIPKYLYRDLPKPGHIE